MVVSWWIVDFLPSVDPHELCLVLTFVCLESLYCFMVPGIVACIVLKCSNIFP